MNSLILHHYPQSPVSEKVRVGLGIKNASWSSVEIPRLPPKPDLMPLTGGYRRTPVMQIGADIFCDSECIVHALDRHIPKPVLCTGAPALWDAGGVFDLIFRLALIFSGDAMPPGFVEDRGRLYLGPDWDMADITAQAPTIIRDLEGRFEALDRALTGKQPFLGGRMPTAEDATAYHLVWFLRGRWSDGPELLSHLPHLLTWEQRIAAIGHGDWTVMDAREALDIALRAKPAPPAIVDASGIPELKLGQRVAITPEGDGGDCDVVGDFHFADATTMAILRSDDRVGEVCVHFPIQGYTIKPV